MIKTMDKELKDLIDYFENTSEEEILKKIKKENEEDFSSGKEEKE